MRFGESVKTRGGLAVLHQRHRNSRGWHRNRRAATALLCPKLTPAAAAPRPYRRCPLPASVSRVLSFRPHPPPRPPSLAPCPAHHARPTAWAGCGARLLSQPVPVAVGRIGGSGDGLPPGGHARPPHRRAPRARRWRLAHPIFLPLLAPVGSLLSALGGEGGYGSCHGRPPGDYIAPAAAAVGSGGGRGGGRRCSGRLGGGAHHSPPAGAARRCDDGWHPRSASPSNGGSFGGGSGGIAAAAREAGQARACCHASRGPAVCGRCHQAHRE